MYKIKVGDTVFICSGKKEDKGKLGKVIRRKGDKITVEGINIKFKHVKQNLQLNTTGGIIKKECPIHISNVKIFNRNTGKSDRVGFIINNGNKFRVFKSTGEKIDN